MNVRRAVAAQFYSGDCGKQIEAFLKGYELPAEPAVPMSGVVPHAGWVYSGSVAAKVIAAFRAAKPETFVIFGAVHRWGVAAGAVYDSGVWSTPLGPVEIDEDLAANLLGACGDSLVSDTTAHAYEHSIEVQVPMIKYLYPGARIVPIAMPPTTKAAAAGAAVGEAIAKSGRRVAVLGSSDLTHYGRNYDFAPWGFGAAAREAMAKSDRRLIDLALAFKADAIVAEAQQSQSACGPGAIAAAVAAGKAMGADRAALVEYTTSHDVMGDPAESFQMAVGYAGILIGR